MLADPYEDVVFSHTEKQRERGWIRGYTSKRQMDSKLGKGSWKAIRRRCIWSETAQKFRMIDNTRTSRHNGAATTLETFYAVHCDVAATNAVNARHSAQRPLTGEYQPFLDTEDLADSYGSIPNHSGHHKHCVVALMHPHWKGNKARMVFAFSRAHLFGYGSAVLNFNRVPCFLAAACVRLGAIPCWHLFDDTGIMSLLREKSSAVDFASVVFSTGVVPFADKKRQPLSDRRLHLGVFNDFVNTREACFLRPKEGRMEKIASKIDAALGDDWCTPTEASSIRSDVTFLACTSHRKVLRGGSQALNIRQQGERGAPLSRELRMCLGFLLAALHKWKPVMIPLAIREERPVIMYVDAYFEEDNSQGEGHTSPPSKKYFGGPEPSSSTTRASTTRSPAP